MSAPFEQQPPEAHVTHDVVSIGIPLVNIEFDLHGRDDVYDQACALLGTGAGKWAPIESHATFSTAYRLLSGQTSRSRNADGTTYDASVIITAGSTGLDTLAALPPEQRQKSAIVSATARTEAGDEDVLSEFFSRSVGQLGLTHYKTPIQGANPSVFILSSVDRPEKAMATYPGVGQELSALPDNLQAKIVHVDAYELRQGPIARLISQVIDSRQFHIALGLGTANILEEPLRGKIMDYIKGGKIHILLGNHEEFKALLGAEEDIDEVTAQSLAIRGLVPHILITLGAKGMCVFRDGEYYHQPAYPVSSVISTAGAGDTAAGVFISGILDNKPARVTLKEAAFYAAQVLTVRGSKLPDGRENTYELAVNQ